MLFSLSLHIAIIEEVAYSGTISPPSDWIYLDNSNQLSKNARIKYKIRVICDKNYYNSTCTVLCKPRNDQFGHYNCNIKGQKECLEGWSGETCDKPICAEGCVHGMCKGPGNYLCHRRNQWLIFHLSRRCMRVSSWL